MRGKRKATISIGNGEIRIGERRLEPWWNGRGTERDRAAEE